MSALEEAELTDRPYRGGLSVASMVTDRGMFQAMVASLCESRQSEYVPVKCLDTVQNQWNAAQALNHALAAATTPWLILAHQDVLFPVGWISRLREQMSRLNADAAVVGLVGCTRQGFFRGHIIDPHGHARWAPLPSKVVSLDEHVLILRTDLNLRFDESIPHFHCYGTDIVLSAEHLGCSAYVVDAPVVHLSAGMLDENFDKSAAVLMGKWGRSMRGVIPTCAKLLTSSEHAFMRYMTCRIARGGGRILRTRKQKSSFRAIYLNGSQSYLPGPQATEAACR